jgi:hypothetical protein
MCDDREALICAYRDFNARNIESVLARMHPGVEWANGMEGGHVFGRDAVRAYWTRQWDLVDPHVEPTQIKLGSDGRYQVKVHQVVRDLKGNLLIDTIVYHLYRFSDGRIKRMDIAQEDSFIEVTE